MPTALTFVPLWHRADEWAHRLRHIREARQFLYLSAFYLEYDRYGQEMLDALLEAQRRGVAVQLILDSFGQTLGGVLMTAAQRRALAEHCDHLTRAGANITHYRPTVVAQRLSGGGQHVKIQVSDTGEVLFGSSNITASSFEGWHEYSVAMTGPIARTLLESLQQIGGTVDPAHLDALPVHDDRADLAFDYWFCNPNLTQSWHGPFGWRGHNEVTQQIIGMVESARQTLRLTSFYFKPTPPCCRLFWLRPDEGCASRFSIHTATRCPPRIWPGLQRPPPTPSYWMPASVSTNIGRASTRRSFWSTTPGSPSAATTAKTRHTIVSPKRCSRHETPA